MNFLRREGAFARTEVEVIAEAKTVGMQSFPGASKARALVAAYDAAVLSD